MKLYPKVQRVLLVLVGSTMTFLFATGIGRPPVPAQIVFALFTAGMLLFTYLGARLGLTIDRNGLTERQIGPTRRVPWSDLGEPSVVEQSGNAGNRLYLMALPHRTGGGEVRLMATARLRRKDAEAIRARIGAFRAQAGQ